MGLSFKSILKGVGQVAKPFLPGWAGTAIDAGTSLLDKPAPTPAVVGGPRALPNAPGIIQSVTVPGAPAAAPPAHMGSKPGFDLGDITDVLGRVGRSTGILKQPDEGGGVNFQNLLKGAGVAGAGALAYGAYKESSKANDRRNELLDEQVGLARTQADAAQRLLQESAPLREAANAAILQRVQAGPRDMPDLSGLVDTANPFRKKFTGGVPARMGA